MSSGFRWSVTQKLALALWALATLVLLFVVILLVREIANSGRDPMNAFQVGEMQPEAAPPAQNRSSSIGLQEIQLFFASADGRSLAPEKRALPFTESAVENCKTVLAALIAGPSAGGAPILPASVTVKSLFLRPEGELVINFSRELQSEHTRSSSAALEGLMVQGVVQTLSQNALQNPRDPKIRRVRFLIENGVPTEAFPSHIDLSDPVAPDGQWLTAQY